MNPICSTDCTTDLPEVSFSTCNPNVAYSEIRRVFIANQNADDLTDVEDETEWAARLALPVSDVNAIRALTVIGDKPAATGVSKDISNGRVIIVGKDHTINYTIDDVSDLNYEMMRQLECGAKLKTWYETEGGYMFGGNKGVKMNHTINDILNRGRDEIETLAGVATWRSKFHPERVESPIFDGETEETADDIVYDTTVTFVGEGGEEQTPASSGVTITLPATDADAQFKFNKITGTAGAAQTMTIKIGTTSAAVVDFPAEYLGMPFRFRDTNGVDHNGIFAAGNVIV